MPTNSPYFSQVSRQNSSALPCADQINLQLSETAMTSVERRRHPRVETQNLISYVCVTKSGKRLTQGMGKTLNISQGGMLLQTHSKIESEYVLLMGMGLQDQIIDIKGRVAFSRSMNTGHYQTGIVFLEKSEKIHKILVNFIKVFHSQKK